MSKPRPIAVISLLLALGCITGLPGLSVNANYRAYFDSDDPKIIAHNELQQRYHQHDSLLVVISAGSPSASTAEAPDHQALIGLVAALSQVLRDLSFVRQVTSIQDVIEPSADQSSGDSELDALFADDATEVANPQWRADPRAKGLLLSPGGAHAIIEVSFAREDQHDANVLLNRMTILRAALAEHLLEHETNVEVAYSGTLALNESYVKVVRSDLIRFAPALVALFFIVLTVLFGTIRVAVILGLSAIGSVVLAFGIAGWWGAELAAINAFVPVMIATLTTASGVHIVVSYLNGGKFDAAAGSRAVRDNLLPLILTNLTTAAGFLGLLLSPSPPIRTVGAIVTCGVLIGLGLNIGLLPKLLRFIPPRVGPPKISQVLRYLDFPHRSRSQVALFALVVALAAVAVQGNRINDNVFTYFENDHPFRRASELIETEFRGINKLIYSVESGKQLGAFAPDLIGDVQRFTGWLNQQPEVNEVMSVLELPKVKSTLEGGDEALSRYRDLAVHLSPAALGARSLIGPEFSGLAVHVYLAPLDSAAMVAFDDKVRAWLAKRASSNQVLGGSGSSLMFARLGQNNATSMLLSFSIALIVISITCGVALRSAHSVWIGLLCNIAPLLCAYAMWAIVDGDISIGAAIVMGMILGVIVDDSVFMLYRFQKFRRTGSQRAVSQTIGHVGPAIVITSITLAAGLSTGLLSGFSPILSMAGLSTAAILLALIFDLCALPALLRITFREKEHT
ncbi:MAG: MMPL family transporter [Pseudomonadota bacterium]